MTDPILPTDDLLDEAGRRVMYKALKMIDAMLDAGATNAEKLHALAAVVTGASEAMLPPGENEGLEFSD